ncbi:peptide deformylase [Gordoniibacillus kamchatkensis]|uniref:Peptide deformylase n=1 Tax=Gordoniibacillus kamchatkensis TaxID=1590651 RepID=A0ABR5AJI1_9BACL|nr:peptide deformylase [Paenibacillus sp. VKM B-2647]KIL41136.1 peptide deformylase [Paenibacillus sp. VKM B-2647]
MAIRMIVKDPDPVLREKAVPVRNFNANLHKLLDDMAETMYDAEGVGLAAPQVGILKRVIVMDCGEEHGGLIELVNPQIVATSGEQLGTEGCLSIPNLQGEVLRPLHVTVKGQDRSGKEVVIKGTELLARCIMHEVDHLNGVLFTDIAKSVYRTDEGGSSVKAE